MTPEEEKAIRRRRRRRRKAIKHALEAPFAWFGIGLGMLLFRCLTHRGLIRVCDVLSAVFYRFDRRGRRRALETLRIVRGTCTGDEGTQTFDPDRAPFDPTVREATILRRSYRNMARTIGHIFWTCSGDAKRIPHAGELSSGAREFLRANRPAVTVSAHVGCWEILSQLAFLEGHRMMSVAKRIGSGRMTQMLMKSRRSIGQEIVEAKGAMKPLMKGIAEGKSLGLLVDQSVDPNDGGLWVRFLGRPMPVSAAPAFFAAKAKAPIAVAWSRPLRDGRYRCEVVDVIPAAEARDIWGTTQRCASDIERIVRRHPSCWVMNYNFFSNIPDEKDIASLVAHEAKHQGDLI